ncbi:histidine phosphatase family protein [Populibacterium corticicola]|uniref:Histidine phosphatase family protein n=1 Tax=Populibacterium corticicola TaxID=1812826 RepID=A0ABW5XCG7_9MICO
MTAGSIVLVRHGRTAYNAAMRLQGQVDIDLDEVGQWQAETSAKVLTEIIAPTRILTSDLNRAIATARTIGACYGVEPIIDKRVRERSFGPWEGMTGEEISARWPEEFAAWRGGSEPTTVGIELKRDVAERMCAVILENAAQMADSETLMVVSHGAAISCAIAGLLGQDATSWRGVAGMSNVHWSRLARNTSPGAEPAWRLEQHNVGPSVVYGKKAWENGPADVFVAL